MLIIILMFKLKLALRTQGYQKGFKQRGKHLPYQSDFGK